MTKKSLVAFLVLIIVMLIGIYYFNKTEVSCEGEIYLLKIGDKTLDIKVADTDSLREKGLSGHKQLGQTEAMLFIFDYNLIPSFWMKEMLFPIHIFWIDKDYNIVGTSKDVMPNTYPAKFSPKTPIRFVLETPLSFSDNPESYIGEKVELICR